MLFIRLPGRHAPSVLGANYEYHRKRTDIAHISCLADGLRAPKSTSPWALTHFVRGASLCSGRCDFVDLALNGYGARRVAPLQGSLERRSAPSPTVSRRRLLHQTASDRLPCGGCNAGSRSAAPISQHDRRALIHACQPAGAPCFIRPFCDGPTAGCGLCSVDSAHRSVTLPTEQNYVIGVPSAFP
jgi:hypothetical protein